MKLRKLLRKARSQYVYRSIYADEYVRVDGLQWVVKESMLVGPGMRPLESIYRFRTDEEARTFRKDRYWQTVARNIANLRKKYNRPSKSNHQELED